MGGDRERIKSKFNCNGLNKMFQVPWVTLVGMRPCRRSLSRGRQLAVGHDSSLSQAGMVQFPKWRQWATRGSESHGERKPDGHIGTPQDHSAG